MDQNIFNENLSLTQQYCALQLLEDAVSPAEILRSISAEYNGEPVWQFEENEFNYDGVCRSVRCLKWNFEPFENDLVPQIYKKQIATKKSVVSQTVEIAISGGKILVCDFDDTVLDGASELISYGLIDLYDLPPVDTWFYLEEGINKRKLFAWIPEDFIHLANEGIEINCVDILYWYEGQGLKTK